MSLAIHYIKGMVIWFGITFIILFLLKRKELSEKREFYKILLIASFVAICSVTLFPNIDFGIDSETLKPYVDFRFQRMDMSGLNLIPFKTIVSQLTGNNPLAGAEDHLALGALNLVGNLMLYIPIGFLLPLAANNKSLAFTLMCVAAMSVSIEVLQFFVGRSADIDDVLLQLVGGAVGYWLWISKNRYLSRKHHTTQ